MTGKDCHFEMARGLFEIFETRLNGPNLLSPLCYRMTYPRAVGLWGNRFPTVIAASLSARVSSGEVAVDRAGYRPNGRPQSFETMGEIRDHADFACGRCAGSGVVIAVARCVVGKISELHRKILVAAGEPMAFSTPELIG
jgi:hypothetical protein